MDETVLRDYFTGDIGPEPLNDNIIGTHVRTGKSTASYEIVDMDIEFQVLPMHVIRLCRDVICKKLQPESLQIIAFALIASEYFTWDPEDEQSDRMDEILHEWCSPEINYALTIDYVRKCLGRLEEK